MNTPTVSPNLLKHEIKETISLGLPLIGSWLIYSLSGFIGTAMVAHLGHDALAASVLVNTLWASLTVFFFGVFSAISVMAAHQYGARNYQAIGEILAQAILLSLAAIIFISITISLAPWIFYQTSQSSAVIRLAIEYAHAMLWSAPGVILLVIFEYFLNGIGRTKLSLAISLIEVPIEILLIYIFVFGKFGVPAFGIAGVGYGLAASFTITVFILLIYFYHADFIKPFQIFKHTGKYNHAYCLEMLKIGLPIGLMYLIEVTTFTVATFFMAKFSTVILAAHQIVMQYLGLTINATFAIAQTASIRIGQNAGRQYMDGIRYAAYVGVGLSFILMLIVSALYVFSPALLLRIDLNIYDPANTELIKACMLLFLVLSIFQLFESIRIVASGALRGLKDTQTAMYVSFLSFWVIGLGFAWLFGFILNWQGVGIWLGLTVGVAVGTVIIIFRLQKKLNTLSGIKELLVQS